MRDAWCSLSALDKVKFRMESILIVFYFNCIVTSHANCDSVKSVIDKRLILSLLILQLVINF